MVQKRFDAPERQSLTFGGAKHRDAANLLWFKQNRAEYRVIFIVTSEWIWRLAKSKQLFGPRATDQTTLGLKCLFSIARAGFSTTEGSFHRRGCTLWELSSCAVENPP
jgi:hypothetical protein